MDNNNYTTAVNNFEALINYVEEQHPELSDKLLDTLREGVYTLKIHPQYIGLTEAPNV